MTPEDEAAEEEAAIDAMLDQAWRDVCEMIEAEEQAITPLPSPNGTGSGDTGLGDTAHHRW
ncbi:hypothetical protein [Roseicella sp. DB1501]|uniref:hypothetical protein n=1 Tax=Roseicella sp. DB1501 TaxID=2730925 RepID=UPI0014928479|nr:hypothetical protein [Roseicella sp. DB1501]NOG69794.1 hypothetical protein [Roseicella sp. DB1501]